MNIGSWRHVAACAHPEVESLVPLHVIYCRILDAVKTKKMEFRRSPESNLGILSTAWILCDPVVSHIAHRLNDCFT